MSSSPEATSAMTPEKDATPEELRGLTPDAIEEFRQAEKQAVLRAVTGVTDPAERIRLENQTMAEVAMSHPEYLEKHGVAVDNPRYTAYLDHLKENSFRAMPDSVWYSGLEHGQTVEPDAPEPVSGRSRAEEKFEQFRTALVGPAAAPNTEPVHIITSATPAVENTEPAAPQSTTEVSPTTPTEHKPLLDRIYDELEHNTNGDTLVFRTALETLKTQRAELAVLAAKEAAKPFSFRRKRYEAAREAYDAKVINVGQHVDQYLSKQREKDGSEARTLDERRADALYYLVGEQNRLRDMSREKFESTRTSAFINWFREGNVMTRLGKGALIAAPIAAVGILTAPVTAVGAGVLAGGVGAARFMRGAAASDNRKNAFKELTDDERRTLTHTMMTEVERDKFAPKRDNEDVHRTSFNAAAAEAGNLFDRQKSKEQKQRRKAVAWGLGSVAAGSAAPWLLGELAERLSDADVRGPSVARPTIETPEPTPEPPEVTPPTVETPEPGVDTPKPGVDVKPTIPEYDFSDAAETLTSREGAYQTFNELNLPLDQAEKHELLHLVGPRLVEMGLAYPAPELGGYGLNMTPDGRMPEEALRYIVDTAREHGYLPGVVDAASAAAETVGEATADTTHSLSGIEDVRDAVTDTIDKGLTSFDEQTGLSELVTDRIDDFQRLENTFPDITGPETIDESTIPSIAPVAVGVGLLGVPVAAGALSARKGAGEASVQQGAEATKAYAPDAAKLKDLGVTKDQWAAFVRDIAPTMRNLKYADGTPVAERVGLRGWKFNTSKSGEVHPLIEQALTTAAAKRGWKK